MKSPFLISAQNVYVRLDYENIYKSGGQCLVWNSGFNDFCFYRLTEVCSGKQQIIQGLDSGAPEGELDCFAGSFVHVSFLSLSLPNKPK